MTLVMPIFVMAENPKDVLVKDSAISAAYCVKKYFDSKEYSQTFQAWQDTSYRKTVRRVKNYSIFEALTCEATGYIHGFCFASIPKDYDDFTKAEKRCQVTGWEKYVLPSEISRGSEKFTLSVLDTLSTGKSCAQAAHALSLAITFDKADLDSILSSLSVEFLSDEELKDVSSNCIVSVHDNGLTEVEPGTLTAILAEK